MPARAAAELLGACRRLDDVQEDAAVLNKPDGRIAYRFHARDLHLVMGPADARNVRPLPRADRRAGAGRGAWQLMSMIEGNGVGDRAAALSADPAAEADRRPAVRDRVSRSRRVEAFAFTFG